ncbi:MAG: hypothetical protein ACJARZ_000698 [Dokdonia sp.]|jgi:hypothetical protein
MSILSQNKRPLIALVLSFFFFICGAFIVNMKLIYTGSLFIFTPALLLVYVPLFWWFSKKVRLESLTSWVQKEPVYLGLWTAFINLVGVIESFSNHNNAAALFFTIASVYAGVFVYMLFRESRKSKTLPIPSGTRNKKILWNAPLIIFLCIAFFLFAIKEEEENGTLVLLGGQELLLELVITFLIGAFLFFVMAWIVQQVKSVWKLKNEKKRTEIAHLQSQVSPHFFFNMLNNLYGLVEEDSKKAQALILKLSDMMRYSIYEGQKSSITIHEEVAYLQNYIELHKLRYHQKLNIQFTTDLKNPDAKLIPLLFILLLENAFKHGVEHLREEAYIHVDIKSNAKEIHCYVKNNFDATYLSDASGIGLKNLKRRLSLAYPKKHNLLIEKSTEVHQVHLTLATL